MRRWSTVLSMLVVVLVGVVMLGRSVSAQDATPVAAPGHPIIGTWLTNTDPENPDAGRSLVTFFADGAFIEYDPDEGGDVGMGRWQATGDLTADLTFGFIGVSDEGAYEGMFKIRASFEVTSDGESFTAQYTGEFVDPDGTGSGEYGPGTATGTRISVEPMGAPVGTFDELFADFEESTPEP